MEHQQPADSPYHRTLPPAGTVVSGQPLVDDWLSCFEAVTLRPLDPMLVPEEPRSGQLDRAECGHCRPSEHTIWHDELWQVRAGFQPLTHPVRRRHRPAASTCSSRTHRSTSSRRSGR